MNKGKVTISSGVAELRDGFAQFVTKLRGLQQPFHPHDQQRLSS